MSNRRNIISDTDLDKEMLENLMNRKIEQKFQYIGEWANLYYSWFESKEENNLNKFLTPKDYANFFLENVSLNSNNKLAIISLGCGNSCQEKYLLEKLEKENITVTYFGVDSSSKMLDLAEKNLQNIKGNKNFILADITTEIFEEEISTLLKDYDQRIFCFLGATFNNPNQTYIADRLYSLLKKDDLLWLDISARKELTLENNINLYEQYENYLKDREEVNSTFFPLKNLGVNLKDGEMELEMLSENNVGALKFLFYFQIKNNKKILFRNKTIHLGEKQSINLLHIRIYHLPTLIKFLESFEFKLINSKTKKIKDSPPKTQLLLSK